MSVRPSTPPGPRPDPGSAPAHLTTPDTPASGPPGAAGPGPGTRSGDGPTPPPAPPVTPAPRPSQASAPLDPPGARRGLGLAYGLAAYLMWGFFPLYFVLLRPAGPAEIIGHRIVWSLVLCAIIVTLTRAWPAVRTVLADRRLVAPLVLAGYLVAGNWLVYVLAILTGHVVDAALGYFINPLVTVALAVTVLHERLRPLQWVGLGVGAAAVVVIGVGVGRLPWMALALAVTFGLYGLVKKRVGPQVPAVVGLGVETAATAPVALAYLIWLQAAGQAHFLNLGPWHALAMVGAGIATTAPLLAFNGAARRLPLTVMGMLQYVTPVMQFLVGVLVFGEHMAPARWWGFALVWTALILVTLDGLLQVRRSAPRRRR